MDSYQQTFDNLLALPIYGASRAQKNPLLLSCLHALHQHHNNHSSEYHNITQHCDNAPPSIDTLPYVAVRLFKMLSLSSISQKDVYRTLYSSGTSGQVPASIQLDAATSQRQSKVLVAILQSFLGKQRRPMLIIDAPSTVKKGVSFSARAAGIQGLSLFGRKPMFALNDDMSLNIDAITTFERHYADTPTLLFGFTFMVWEYFIEALKRKGLKLGLSKATLIHSGGWKKLEAKRVSNESFKSAVYEQAGVNSIHNFYGMAEQVGSIFMECEKGYLHAPAFADVIVRDPYTLAPAKRGEEGLLQVVSAVPTSYPGHSILTEDLGVLHGEDNCECKRLGKFFTVSARLPKTEVRGCSDTAS